MDLLPSNIDLSAAEVQLVSEVAREQTLARALAPVLPDYDFVLIDCQPSLGLLTVNALTAADEVIIPLECEFFSLRGVALLIDTIEKVRERLNPRLHIAGILATMYDSRTCTAARSSRAWSRRSATPSSTPSSPGRCGSRRRRSPASRSPRGHLARPGAKAYRNLAQEVLAPMTDSDLPGCRECPAPRAAPGRRTGSPGRTAPRRAPERAPAWRAAARPAGAAEAAAPPRRRRDCEEAGHRRWGRRCASAGRARAAHRGRRRSRRAAGAAPCRPGCAVPPVAGAAPRGVGDRRPVGTGTTRGEDHRLLLGRGTRRLELPAWPRADTAWPSTAAASCAKRSQSYSPTWSRRVKRPSSSDGCAGRESLR